jgi:hypothetical protein
MKCFSFDKKSKLTDQYKVCSNANEQWLYSISVSNHKILEIECHF